MEGMNFTRVLSKKSELVDFLKLSSGVAQDNYPEIMHKLLIINAPMMFNLIWLLVKGFFDEKTVKKINIMGR